MKKYLPIYFFLAIIICLLFSCGESPKIPNIDALVYKIVSIDEPTLSSNGYISPTQNLIYSIEIDHPLPKDSLGVIQNYFINRGKEDFPRINKIIVRVYLKGTASPGLPPYASLVLIGSNKEIEINEDANKVAEALTQDIQEEQKSEPAKVPEKKDPLVGRYFCNRTHDTYIFNSDNTGIFIVQGCSPSNFTWKRLGSNVTVTHESFGDENLKYDQRKETLTEKSESLGTLVFNKQ